MVPISSLTLSPLQKHGLLNMYPIKSNFHTVFESSDFVMGIILNRNETA